MTDVPAPLIMGVVNVTPDSFSDGGCYLDTADAIRHGLALYGEGADIVDVGGESTRPGALPVETDEELRRVVPVVEALSQRGRVSIDTRHAAVAEAAIAAGATLVNDVSASLAPVVAAAGPLVGWVAMHMLGDPRTMQSDPRYADVVGEVLEFVLRRASAARDAGVEEVWIDPGIGFGKTTAHNLALLRHLDRFVDSGVPVVIGTSRKRFLGSLMADADAGRRFPGEPTATDDRLEGSLATAVWAIMQGVRMVRVHDVRATVRATKVVTG